jgi:hypothetical protein
MGNLSQNCNQALSGLPRAARRSMALELRERSWGDRGDSNPHFRDHNPNRPRASSLLLELEGR